jgi:hypothetical protein
MNRDEWRKAPRKSTSELAVRTRTSRLTRDFPEEGYIVPFADLIEQAGGMEGGLTTILDLATEGRPPPLGCGGCHIADDS